MQEADYLETRNEVLKEIEKNFKLIKKNCKEVLFFVKEIKEKLASIRVKNQELMRRAYVMDRIDALSSLLSDLLKSTELLDITRELKNVKKDALELSYEILNVLEENIKEDFEIKVKKIKGWMPWKRKKAK